MTKEELLKQIKFINDPKSTLGIEIYFQTVEKDKLALKKADIADEAKGEILRLLKDYIKVTLTENEELLFRKLSEIDNRKNSVYSYDYDEIPVELQVLNTDVDLQKLPKFDFSKQTLEDLRGYLIVIGNSHQHKIRIFKNFNQLSLIKRDTKYLGLKEDNQRLVMMDKDVLRISGSFEFMKVEDEIIIVNDKALGVLQREFGFDKIIKEKANVYLDKIEAKGLLADINDLKGIADDVKFARKIMNIKSTSKVLDLKPQTVIDFALKHPMLSKKFKFNKTNTKLILKTKVSKQLFLQLLNDDFLKSELTNLYYFTENKDALEEEKDK